MRYIDLEGHTHEVYDVGGYIHNNECFYEKSTYQMSLNKGRTTTTKGTHTSLVGIISFLLFLSWRRAFNRTSNHLKIVWILLEDRHLQNLVSMFSHTY